MLAAAATSSKALWYVTRGTGMVSLVLLTLSVALGIAQVVRFASPRWPRFVVAALHRNVSLLAVAFLAVHIATAVADSFAPIRLVDAFVPFVGCVPADLARLGRVAFDLLLALVDHEPAARADRLPRVACGALGGVRGWPVALLHGLGTGSDTRARWALVVNVRASPSVLAAVLVRVGLDAAAPIGRRALAALGSVAVAIGVVAWMMLEPMRPGWARKAGTPSALLPSAAPAPPARRRARSSRSRSRARPRHDPRRPARRPAARP